jgi:hypothetical protein
LGTIAVVYVLVLVREGPAGGGARAARGRARGALVAEDPYFASGVFEPVAVEWKLVGIDLAAIDFDLT